MKDKPKGAMKPKKPMSKRHSDYKEEKSLVKKMVKKGCVK